MAERENYYLLLGLELTVDDAATIQKRIQDKQREWSLQKSQGNPLAQRKAAKYLQLLDEIKATLNNEETRRLEAKDAQKRLEGTRQAKSVELDDAIAVLKAAGSCTPDAIQKIVKQLAGSFSEQEVKARIHKAGIRLDAAGGAEGSVGPTSKEQIEEVMKGGIKRNLEILNLPSLYALLDRNPRSSALSLREKADEMYKEILHRGDTSVEPSARKELCGFCLKLFCDESGKARYDNTLAVEAMDQLRLQLEVAGTDFYISNTELDAILSQARAKGVEAEAARAYVLDFARKRKWGVQLDQKLPSDELKLCGYCSTLNSSHATHCKECGEALSIACPKCGADTPTEDRSCSTCGCHTGDAPVVHALMKEAKTLAGADISAALQRIDRALYYWPDWKPALAEKKRLEELRNSRDTSLDAIKDAVRAKRMAQADRLIVPFKRQFGSGGIVEIEKQVSAAMAAAEAAWRRAETLRTSGANEQALEQYELALTSCSDFEPAHQALSRFPPPAPRRLRVQSLPQGFRLTWDEVTPRGGIVYRVRRKRGGLPSSASDGDLVGDVQVDHIDDVGMPGGLALYYAVFSVRRDVPSSDCCHSGPHLLTAEASNVQLQAGDRQISLRWNAPAGAKRVDVWRKTGGAPPGPGEGTRITISGEAALDSDVVNGTLYSYLLTSVFADPAYAGKEIYTPGCSVSGKPVSPPPPVTDLQCRLDGKTALLTWTPVPGARVQIMHSSAAPAAIAGLIVGLDDAGRFGAPITSSSAGSAQHHLSGQGRFYFIPLSVVEHTAVVGNAASISTVDDITGLKSRCLDRQIILQWLWPAGIDEVLVRYAYDRSPQSPDSGPAPKVRVTRAEYERLGGWELRAPNRSPHHFTVFAKGSGGDVFSTGVQISESMGRAISVKYQVGLKKSLFGRAVQEAWVELECPGLRELPALEVRIQERMPPLFQSDGRQILEVAQLDFTNGKAKISIPIQHCKPGAFAKLFLQDARHSDDIRLLPAEKEKLALG